MGSIEFVDKKIRREIDVLVFFRSLTTTTSLIFSSQNRKIKTIEQNTQDTMEAKQSKSVSMLITLGRKYEN